VSVLAAVGLRRAAAVTRHPTARLVSAPAETAGSVARRLLTAAVTRPEAIVPAAGGLPDGEIGRGPGRWWRPFETRQRRAYQRSMNRPLVVPGLGVG